MKWITRRIALHRICRYTGTIKESYHINRSLPLLDCTIPSSKSKCVYISGAHVPSTRSRVEPRELFVDLSIQLKSPGNENLVFCWIECACNHRPVISNSLDRLDRYWSPHKSHTISEFIHGNTRSCCERIQNTWKIQNELYSFVSTENENAIRRTTTYSAICSSSMVLFFHWYWFLFVLYVCVSHFPYPESWICRC